MKHHPTKAQGDDQKAQLSNVMMSPSSPSLNTWSVWAIGPVILLYSFLFIARQTASDGMQQLQLHQSMT